MADHGAERETLLAQPLVMDARKRLDEAIHEYGKDMKIQVITLPNSMGVPTQVLETNCLIDILGTTQAAIMDLKREVTVMGSITKILTLYIDESVIDEVTELCADVINKHAERIEKAAARKKEKAKKSSIITDMNSGLATTIKQKHRKPNFGNN